MKFYLSLSVSLSLSAALMFASFSPVLAGTVSKGHLRPPAPVQDFDNYNPDSDPLPEWLILPEGISENDLKYSGNQNSTLTVRATEGKQKWVITTKKDGKQISYKYYESNKLQFGLRTTLNYLKVGIYNEKGKKVKTVSGADFFDESIQVSSLRDISQGANVQLAATRGNGEGSEKVNKVRKNKKLTKRQLSKLAYKVGFRGEGRKLAVAVAQAESRGRIGEVLCNTTNPYNPKHKFERGVAACRGDHASADRGLWQINNYWHKSVTNKCAFNVRCNAKKAYRISNGGRNWTPWSTYNNQLYKQHL